MPVPYLSRLDFQESGKRHECSPFRVPYSLVIGIKLQRKIGKMIFQNPQTSSLFPSPCKALAKVGEIYPASLSTLML